MPAKKEDRTTINIGEELIRAARARADEEGRSFSDVVATALTLYLDGPPRAREDVIPGLVPVAPGLREEMQVLLSELRRFIPLVAAGVENHGELMDTVDEIALEIGRRRGAALALETAQALTAETPEG